jgi:hypothetical protein
MGAQRHRPGDKGVDHISSLGPNRGGSQKLEWVPALAQDKDVARNQTDGGRHCLGRRVYLIPLCGDGNARPLSPSVLSSHGRPSELGSRD